MRQPPKKNDKARVQAVLAGVREVEPMEYKAFLALLTSYDYSNSG